MSAVFGYGRVSTKGQTAENQRLEVEQAGYKVAYWFQDEGVSGKVPAKQRPEFAKLLAKIRDGERLVVSKLDRLGRDSIDVEQTLRDMEERGIGVIVLQLGGTDLTSTAGKLIRKVLGAVADMERDLLIERTQAGLQRAKAEGKRLGRPSKTTDRQRGEILKRVEGGEAIAAIARDYDISRASIYAMKDAAEAD